MEKTIKLLGLNRSVPDNLSPDGGCMQLLNMRFRHGAWRPVGTKRVHKNLPQEAYTCIWLHDLDNGIIPGEPNWIGYHAPTGSVSLINPDTGLSTEIGKVNVMADVRIAFLKRTMIVSSDSSLDTYLFTSQKQYVGIGSLPVPEVTLSLLPDSLKSIEAVASDLPDAVTANYFTALDEANRLDGSMAGSLMYISVYRLFDGSYLLPTIPRYFQVTNKGLIKGFKDPTDTIPTKASFSFEVGRIRTTVKNHYSSEGQENIMASDLVDAICVFATPITTLHDINPKLITQAFMDSFPDFISDHPYKDVFPVSDKFRTLLDSEGWYKIHEFSFERLTAQEEDVTEEVDTKGYYKDYATRQALPTDQGTHHSILSREVFVYNDRLHLYNVRTEYGKPYIQPPSQVPWGMTRMADIPCVVSVWMKTGMGEVVHNSPMMVPAYSTEGSTSGEGAVQRIVDFPNQTTASVYLSQLPFDPAHPLYVPNSGYIYVIEVPSGQEAPAQVIFWEYLSIENVPDTLYYYLPPVIGYNDARAYKMQVVTENGGKILFEDKLKKNSIMNYATWHNPNFHQDPDQEGYNYPMRTLISDNLVFTAPVPGTLSTGFDTNRLQVSEIQNPLIFPAKNSYQVGTGDGLALMAGSDPLSTGQFGQFPLMAFSTKGIWALETDTGEVLYTRIVPVNAEVVNNRHNIISIGSGSILFTTDRGLFLMQGRDVQRISEPVEGAVELSFVNNPHFQGAIQGDRFTQLASSVAVTDFLSYITGSQVGYDHHHREMIVTNPQMGYSYVFSLEAKTWTSVSGSYSLLINAYPDLWGFTAQKCLNISREDELFYMDCMFATKPVSLGNRDVYKKINRCILRGECTTDAIHHAGFYLFASDDLETWQLIRGIQRNGNKLKDLLLQRSHGSARFYVMVFCGRIKENSLISYIDTDMEEKWTNKKR